MVSGTVMLSPVVSKVGVAGVPHVLICCCCFWSISQRNCMSMAFIVLGRMVLVTMPRAVKLCVWMAVGCCVCPISTNVACITMAFHALMNDAPSSALATDNMTVLMTFAMLWIAPLLWGNFCLMTEKLSPYSAFGFGHTKIRGIAVDGLTMLLAWWVLQSQVIGLCFVACIVWELLVQQWWH